MGKEIDQTNELKEIGRLPAPGDNVAIAGRRLTAGTVIRHQHNTFTLDHDILEGHRFAVTSIKQGAALLSWGLPFGVATRNIEPGNYVCNGLMIEALRGRSIDFEIPRQPNFRDQIKPYILDEEKFQPGRQIQRYEEPRFFMGYRRPSTHSRNLARGVGTRNMIVILGTTSRTASFARALEARFQGSTNALKNIDGVIAISHTEGSGDEKLNNKEFLLRTLAGLMVHANTGAVLVIDDGPDQISNEDLRQYMIDHHYPLGDLIHEFMALQGDFQADMAIGETIIRNWFEPVGQISRTQESLAHLKIALQCGGSDAFSGVSGNPLAAAVAREVIRYGGIANLGETDELIGAESYFLQNVKDLETARAFLNHVARFKERLAWHGATAEGNPTGGNRYRGLYNIVLKSIGAAMKRHPNVCLDYVVDYSQPMQQPGFYFMNTPGNDLESIAGQVAGGSNMILFVTGNGSITNFPLVPTIKIMTTTGRYNMLSHEMDVNAGAYQDGVEMADLVNDTVDLMVNIASGQLSFGEKASHAQVSIWRNWRQTDKSQVQNLQAMDKPDGRPLPVPANELAGHGEPVQWMRKWGHHATNQVGLVLPTSLCASQIARIAAERLNQTGRNLSNPRFVALTHTEGCGVWVGSTSDIYDRTMINYIIHPLVKAGLFLEHGCEKTHNDYMCHLLEKQNIDPEKFGWASIQMDGGIEPVLGKIRTWFQQKMAMEDEPISDIAGREFLSLGLLSSGPIPDTVARSLAQLTQMIITTRGSVVLPDSASLLNSAVYLEKTLSGSSARPTLAYGQAIQENGFHVMVTPSAHWVETLTGLGATGVGMMLAYIDGRPRQGHPMIPLIQMTADAEEHYFPMSDFDLILRGEEASWVDQIMQLLMKVVSGQYQPKSMTLKNVDFQITRGLLGIST